MPKLVLSGNEITDVLIAHLRAKMKWDVRRVHLHFISERDGDALTLRVEVNMPEEGTD